ncbi:MAG: hypothetical protein Q9228_005907 [Teloschistes exilis]
MSAPSSNTGGLGYYCGPPPVNPPRIVSRYDKTEGGFVSYRGPAPEAPVLTLAAAGMTDRNEALGLIHLQGSIPWQWGEVTPVGGVVPDALQDLTELVDSWAITIMHSNPFTMSRPEHAYYVNKVFYEMPDGGWLVFDLLTGRRLDTWNIMFLDDYQAQDPTGIGSIDWRQSFPALIPGPAAGTPSGDQPQSQQNDREAAANTDQQGQPDPTLPESIAHSPLAAITPSCPSMADTGIPQDQRTADQMPMPLPPNRHGGQDGGLVHEADDEPTIQQPNVSRSPSVASPQVSQNSVEQDFRVPASPQIANSGNADHPSLSPAGGLTEQWTPAPPSAYKAPHDNFSTSPSFEEEGIIDLTKLVAPRSRSSITRVPSQTARANPSSQSSHRPELSYVQRSIPPSQNSSRNVFSSPPGRIPPLHSRERPMAEHMPGALPQSRSHSRPAVVPTLNTPPSSIATSTESLMRPPSAQGTRRQRGPSTPGARPLATAPHGQYTLQPQGIQPFVPTTQYIHSRPDQQGNTSGSNKRKRAPGLEGNSGDREARRVRLTQENDSEDFPVQDSSPSAFRTPSATSGTERAAAEAKARKREEQVQMFRALPLEEKKRLMERFAERRARKEAARSGQTGQQLPGTQEDPAPSLSTPMVRAMPSSGSSQSPQGGRNSQRDVTGGVRGQNTPATISRSLRRTSYGPSRNAPRGQASVPDAYELSQWIEPSDAVSMSHGPHVSGPETSREGGGQGQGYHEVPSQTGIKRPGESEPTSARSEKRPRIGELPAGVDTAQTMADPQTYDEPIPPTSDLGPASEAAFDAIANIQLDEDTQAWLDGLPDLERQSQWNPTDPEVLNFGPSAPQPPAQMQSAAVNEADYDEYGLMTEAAMMRWAASTRAETEGMTAERNAPSQASSGIERSRTQTAVDQPETEDFGNNHPSEPPQICQKTTPAENISADPALNEDSQDISGSPVDNNSLFNEDNNNDPEDTDKQPIEQGPQAPQSDLQTDPPSETDRNTPAVEEA